MELRKSHTELNQIYFFTATIHKWQNLLADEYHKALIVDYLRVLSDKGLIAEYGYVVMPNHIHFIWEHLKKNGKETPQASFLNNTSHEFLKSLKKSANQFCIK